jgi:hypothetical protein
VHMGGCLASTYQSMALREWQDKDDTQQYIRWRSPGRRCCVAYLGARDELLAVQPLHHDDVGGAQRRIHPRHTHTRSR